MANKMPYTKIQNLNNELVDIRNKQNLIYDKDLPLSMQRADKCNLEAARILNSKVIRNHANILNEIYFLLSKGYLGYSMTDIDEVQKNGLENQSLWKPIWIKFMGNMTEISKFTPILASLCNDSRIYLLHISVFWSPVELPEHRGITMSMYRYHYGLSIPKGNTGMKIAGKQFRWKVGEGVIWDDTLLHSSWNKTGNPRLIIFADIMRDIPKPILRKTRLLDILNEITNDPYVLRKLKDINESIPEDIQSVS